MERIYTVPGGDGPVLIDQHTPEETRQLPTSAGRIDFYCGMTGVSPHPKSRAK